MAGKEFLSKNDTHQLDLFFATDEEDEKVPDTFYKYGLTIIDVATRYKECEPIKSKTSKDVKIAIEKIYARSPLDFPNLIQVDGGNEFKGVVSQMYMEKGTKIVDWRKE